ncbi:SHOCT domain-containing protein [Nocardioides mangrovi]|uniref:SHOCT domain-containing protein n=1 Tax=Nocardioides mangrovi TaxID=2874580 RepID=A0ABS7U9V8_9ACTN|nr:SHOCT domain-containing protein [Nocardioides mangrovi]MBZ5737647.1 SHOCT domain-containing protein [Nocardioides mangrovi]
MTDASGEQLWSVANGAVEGLPARLQLTDSGLSMQLEGEPAPVAVSLREITDVTAQIGLLTGFVTLELGEETITVSRIPKAEARAFTEALRAQLRHLPAAPDPASDPAPDPAAGHRPEAGPSGDGSPLAELERLARLHASGVLTDEEFQAAKRTLLGRL